MKVRLFYAFLACIAKLSLMALTEFDVSVTNALLHKENLVDPAFTNYIHQCANQSTNLELALSANIIRCASQIEMFNETMDEMCLTQAFQSVSNALASPFATTGTWQFWHAQMLQSVCMNTDNNVQGSYLVSSNAWEILQNANLTNTTNTISKALFRYYGVDDDITMFEAVTLIKALSADAIGKTGEVECLKTFLPFRLRQELEAFISN